jgi:hypothetical protein
MDSRTRCDPSTTEGCSFARPVTIARSHTAIDRTMDVIQNLVGEFSVAWSEGESLHAFSNVARRTISMSLRRIARGDIEPVVMFLAAGCVA